MASQRRCESIPLTLSDLVVEMQGAAANLGQGLHNDAAFELADLGGVMNCYYSNLIEGHNTRPRILSERWPEPRLRKLTSRSK